MNPWVWAIVALAVAIAELHTPGYYLIWIAAGAAATAIAGSYYDLALSTQILIFVVASVIACLCGYFIYRWLATVGGKTVPVNRRALDLIGTRGVVAETITNGHGKVRLGDTVWLAEGPDLASGTAVVVSGVRGTTVIVASI